MYTHCPIVVAVTGFGVLFLGIVCSWYVFPKLVLMSIYKSIALVDGNPTYQMWLKPPFPILYKIYMFNVTNPEAVQNGDTPILKELGPYVYNEFQEKVDVTVNEEADTITYYLRKVFTFNAELSGCRSEDDDVIILNPGMVSSAVQVNKIMPSALQLINDAIPFMYKGAKDIFLRAKVKDLNFGGILIACHDEEVEFICDAMKGMTPPNLLLHENGKDFVFSFFGYLNGTKQGPWEVGRGISKTIRGQVMKYSNNPNAVVWSKPECNMLNGSDGTTMYPIQEIPEKLYSFSPEICRSVFVNFEKSINYMGTQALRFSNKEAALDYTSDSNKCFCSIMLDNDDKEMFICPNQGLMDLSPCMKSPVMASFPHFYLADTELLKYPAGLNPVKEKHESFVIIEPITGTVLEGARRLQMNAELKNFEDVTLLNNVSDGLFPLIWIEESLVLPPPIIEKVIEGLSQIKLLDIVKWSMIISGVLLMFLAYGLVAYKERMYCFANVPTGKVNITESRKNLHNDSEMDLSNSQVMYPTLYPQLENKDMVDRLQKRKISNVTQAAWQTKHI